MNRQSSSVELANQRRSRTLLMLTAVRRATALGRVMGGAMAVREGGR